MNGVIELCDCGISDFGLNNKHNMTVSELLAMSTTTRELSLFGINERMLFNIFINLNSLEDKKLDIDSVLAMDGLPKKRWKLRLRRRDFKYICSKAKKSDIFNAVKRESAKFVDNEFLRSNNFTESDVVDLAKSFIVYGKINISPDDILALGIDHEIARVAHKSISINFNLARDSYFCNKSSRCPLLRRCDDFFRAVSDKHHLNFSCDECIFYKCEKRLEREGAFRENYVQSYGISDYDSFF